MSLLAGSLDALPKAPRGASSSSNMQHTPDRRDTGTTEGMLSFESHTERDDLPLGAASVAAPAAAQQETPEISQSSKKQEPMLQHPEGAAATTDAPSSIGDHPAATALGSPMTEETAPPAMAIGDAARSPAGLSPLHEKQAQQQQQQQAQQQQRNTEEDSETADLWVRGQQQAQLALQQLQSVQKQLRAMEEQQTVFARRALELPSPAGTPGLQNNQQQQPLEQQQQQQQQQQPGESSSSNNPASVAAAGEAGKNAPLQEAAVPQDQQQSQQPAWWGSGLWHETVSSPLGPHRHPRNLHEQEQHQQQQQQRPHSNSIPDLSTFGWLSGAARQQQHQPHRASGRSSSMGILSESDSLSAAIASLSHFVENLGWNLTAAPAPTAATTAATEAAPDASPNADSASNAAASIPETGT